jgi:hypothetical protein
MSAITSKLARFGAILFFPMLGCMADASDVETDDVELGEQSEALSCPPWRPVFPIETPAVDGPKRPRPRPLPPECDPCASVRCAEGTHCEAFPIVCVRAPCPSPQVQCVPDEKPDADAPACGGIANSQCPGLGECVDNPYDDCNPRRGGDDCGGLCVCEVNRNCAPPLKWDGSADVCDCVEGPVFPGPELL